jgi:hypothetical protein
MRAAGERGFRLGETPVAAFLSAQGEKLGDPTTPAYRAASEQMKSLQRVYQISRDDESMAVLMALNITSAYDAMAYGEAQFVRLFEAKYLELYRKPPALTLARQTFHKIGQVNSVVYNLFTIARKMQTEPAVAGMAPPLQAQAQMQQHLRDSLLKHYPTLETLFGSLDYCPCDHCRSVLSPAAYFVDLLQFTDTDNGVWGNFLAQWQVQHGGRVYPHQRGGVALKPYDVLLQRRPDLPHIALTCENTHTALPYIDIVNEILEYQLANGALAEEAARDTGSVSSAELLAEPQHVIDSAYDTLASQRYPLALPYDLWTDTARRFAAHFEMPLARLLEVFRRSDVLIAPVAGELDRATTFFESLNLSPADVALFADPAPLAGEAWKEMYGWPKERFAIMSPVNPAAAPGAAATLLLAEAHAARLRPGQACSYFDVSANRVAGDSLVIAAIGAPNRRSLAGCVSLSPAAGRRRRLPVTSCWSMP